MVVRMKPNITSVVEDDFHSRHPKDGKKFKPDKKVGEHVEQADWIYVIISEHLHTLDYLENSARACRDSAANTRNKRTDRRMADRWKDEHDG